jgi:hypothetical protein
VGAFKTEPPIGKILGEWFYFLTLIKTGYQFVGALFEWGPLKWIPHSKGAPTKWGKVGAPKVGAPN